MGAAMHKEPFWVVWNPIHGLPRVQHSSEEAAVNEAKRLARNNKGQNFYVLAASHHVIVDPVNVTRISAGTAQRPWDDRDIPF